MKIETKFNVGETIWFISNDRPTSRKIESIYFFSNGCDTISVKYAWNRYHSNDLKYADYINEKLAFQSKEELLASL